MKLLGTLLLTALGMALGFALPDLDLKLAFAGLLHRSILTHGCLAPLLAAWLAKDAGAAGRALLGGLCAALAIHLCFDLFPVRWIGFALITIPLLGRTSALVSWLWIAASSVICLILLFRCRRGPRERIVALLSLAVGFVLALPRPLTAGLLPLVALLSAVVLAAGVAAHVRPSLRSSAPLR